MNNFEECPRCGRSPGFEGAFMVYECKKCGSQFCDECGANGVCPECKAADKEEAGECRPRR